MQECGIPDNSYHFASDTGLLHAQGLTNAGTHTGASVHGEERGIGGQGIAANIPGDD